MVAHPLKLMWLSVTSLPMCADAHTFIKKSGGRVRSPLLIIPSKRDQTVNPTCAEERKKCINKQQRVSRLRPMML